jgi:two-component system sensor histidine kinase/response regulator
VESKKIKILYIDDEMPNLLGFKASFRFNYDIFIANNPSEAIDILEKNPSIQVILSDQRMPINTGVELFETIRRKFPYPIRILITGYTDIESVIDAINRGHIFRYIKKPWTENDIISAIDEAHKFYVTTSLLALKNEELKKAYNELDKFAYSVTHDLRGPIMSISGAIELLKNEKEVKTIHDMLFLIQTAVEKLDGFIGNIHDYYKVKRGELQIEEISFENMIGDLKGIYSVSEKVNNVKFTTHLKQSGSFRSDSVSIRLILNNLLSNAFKYQKKDNFDKWVDLNIHVENGKATIDVKDNGIGINNNYIDQIFNMFYRATSEEVGSGFGLYNVKDALKKIDGDIRVSSTLHEGTLFEVIIPSKK